MLPYEGFYHLRGWAFISHGDYTAHAATLTRRGEGKESRPMACFQLVPDALCICLEVRVGAADAMGVYFANTGLAERATESMRSGRGVKAEGVHPTCT